MKSKFTINLSRNPVNLDSAKFQNFIFISFKLLITCDEFNLRYC